MDVKYWSASSNIFLGVQPLAFILAVTSKEGLSGEGLTRSSMLTHDCAHMFPRRCAGMGPVDFTTSSP